MDDFFSQKNDQISLSGNIGGKKMNFFSVE